MQLKPNNAPSASEERQGTISNVYNHLLLLNPCNSSRNWALELLLDLGILENSLEDQSTFTMEITSK